MPDTTPEIPPPHALLARFARLVALVQAQPTAVADQRAAVRAVVKAAKRVSVDVSVGESDLPQVDGSDVEASDTDVEALRLLAARAKAYGLLAFTISGKSADADLHDLARLLGAEPTQDDPVAHFAVRASAIDPRGIPRTLRILEAPPAPEPAPIPVAAAVPPPEPAAAPPEIEEAPSATDLRSEQLTEALPVPESSDPDVRAAVDALRGLPDLDALASPLDRLVVRADLAFRTGAYDAMTDAMAALVALEFQQLSQDASDDRRRAFAQALRRLASPLLLRQVAVLRHRRAGDAASAARLQAVLHRFGTDGAEALIDEWGSAPTAEARAVCLASLKALRRTHDALFGLVRDTREFVVRQAAAVLAELGDARAEQMLIELLRHPEARVRHAATAALERFPSSAVLDALGVALLDDTASVRSRAVAALVPRGAPAVALIAPLLDTEPEREVLCGAMAALGSIATPEAVAVLIRCAAGETEHPRKRHASYRLEACAALVRIRSPQSMAAVQGLRDDRDREVREGALRLVAQAARRSTLTMRAVTAP